MLNIMDRREFCYGIPAADQILANRYYMVGYSYYFRQAKWAMKIVDTVDSIPKRVNDFRPDYLLPSDFRAVPTVYHQCSDEREATLQNSETFLLSNVSPQLHTFNPGIWENLEIETRELANKKLNYFSARKPRISDRSLHMVGEDHE